MSLALALGAMALLSACGGGDPVVPFEPTRVLAFGYENSLIITPHIAWASRTARQTLLDQLADIIGQWQQGTLLNPVLPSI